MRTAQAVKDRSGDSDKAKQLTMQVGMLSSALEHQVPEQMFTDPNSATKPEGFSTAKALGMAMAQGQKIYTINLQNQAQALQNLRLDSAAMEEIRSSLATGKEVITHTDQLTVPGYRGSGYAILDPITGEGVYKISGGKNGGFIAGVLFAAAMVTMFVAIAAGTAGLGTLAAVYLMAASLSVLVASLKHMYGDDPNFWGCFRAGFSAVSLVNAIFGFRFIRVFFSVLGIDLTLGGCFNK